MYFTWQSILSWCIYSKTEYKRALYIFTDRLYSEQFCFSHWGARIIFRFISIHGKLEFLYFTWVSILSWCIYSKTERIGHCTFFLTDYIQSNFVFNIGVPRLYLDFFDSGKIRISVFYMSKHTVLVYILQNRVEKGIVYFFWQIIFRAILLLTLGSLDNIKMFLILINIEFLYFTWESILCWFIYSKTE